VPPKSNSFNLTLPSKPTSITKVEPFLKKIVDALGLDDEQMNKLMVAVTEAVNNAIVHGNKQDPKKNVTIRSEVQSGELLIVVRDQGKGFNPASLRNPLQEENLMLTNGRGVFLMRSLMDKVEVSMDADGTRVELSMSLDRKG
jgi:serine/threonine-protein kinase RsbW